MAIINKDKYLKDIGSLVQKGVMYFDADDRPRLEMGGRKVFISSVSYDMDRGDLTYTVSNQNGVVLPSAYGVRPLAELDSKTLSSVSEAVHKAAALRVSRENNILNVESRLQMVNRRRSSLGL